MVSRNALIIGTTFVIGAAVTGAYLLMTLGSAGSSRLQRFAKPAVSLAVPHGWTVEEEPLAPVATLLNFSKPEFARKPQTVPGAVPMITLKVEDMTGSGINMEKFLPVTRLATTQQLEGMTGGTIKPTTILDEAMPVGIFEHCLRHNLETPHASVHLLSLLTTRDGFTYLLQLFGSPEVVDKHKHMLFDIATSLVPESKPVPAFNPKEGSSVTVTTDTLKVSVPAAWMTLKRNEGDLHHLSFRTPAIAAPEVVLVFLTKDHLTQVPSDGRAVDMVIEGYPNKVVSNGTYTIRCESYSPNAAVVTSGETLEAVLASITPSSAAAPPVYRNVEQGIEFTLEPRYKLHESRLGDGLVVYAPDAKPEPGVIEDGTAVKISVYSAAGGSADDCYTTLSLQAAQVPGLEIKKVHIGGNDVVVTKRIVKGIAQGNHIIFKRGKMTTLAWITDDWKTFESTLDAMAASVEVL